MNSECEYIRERLFALRDLQYKDFHSRLMPSVDPRRIIGVRVPDLRRLSKELYGTHEAEIFLDSLPHEFYEENNLHAFLIEKEKDFDECARLVRKFLPHIDNWATCDSMRPKAFKKDLKRLEAMAYSWIESGNEYTVRYGIECLMVYFSDIGSMQKHMNKVSQVNCDKYYVSMMVAWYFATALAKQYHHAVGYLEKRILDPLTHRKTIQKAVESYRISDEQKNYLKSLK